MTLEILLLADGPNAEAGYLLVGSIVGAIVTIAGGYLLIRRKFAELKIELGKKDLELEDARNITRDDGAKREFERKKNELEVIVKQWETLNKKLEENLDRAHSKIEAAATLHTQQMISYEGKLSTITERCDNQSREIRQIKDENRSLRVELRDLREELSKLRSENEKLRQDNDELRGGAG